MATPSEDITLSGVLSETRRIFRAYRNHFSILSLLFLEPFFVLLFLYPTIFSPVFQTNSNTFFLVLYIIVAFVLSISAIGTITYSTFHAYYNQPLEVITTLKSLLSSFVPLCSTLVVIQLIISSIGFLIGVLGYFYYFIYNWLKSDDTNITFKSEYFFWSIILVMLMILVSVRYFQGNWILSNVIVVVESKWGYDPLRRSAYLMNGMRKIVMKMYVMFGVPSFLFMYIYYWRSWKADSGDTFSMWTMVAGSCGMTALVEYGLAATVVLYINCMKMHGELGMEIQGEEYVSLPTGDDGNKSVAGVVPGSG